MGLVAVAATIASLVAAEAAAAAGEPTPEPGVCEGCQPPLIYHGGLVMGTSQLTITPIYWAPAGFSFPGNYESIVNTYIDDVAAASGASDNTYSILPEYYQQIEGIVSNIEYKIVAGPPIVDSNPYPVTAAPCSVTAPYKTCTNESQVQAELESVLKAHGLTADVNHLYVLLFPPETQTLESKSRSNVGFCGIHKAFNLKSGTGTVVYADEPYISTGCTSGQSPNGNIAADTQVDTLSHEVIEAATDPGVSGEYSWYDKAGQEIGDECSYNYGPPLGSTDESSLQTSEYNQVINGDKYYTQTIFSNASYNALGQGKGCILGAFKPAASTATVAAPHVASSEHTATLEASPTSLPADGTSTSSVAVTVLDEEGEPVVGDHVHFDVRRKLETPSGTCGTLGSYEGVTDSEGQVTETYTASTDPVACSVMAIDAESGSSDSATIYQGSASKVAPVITDATVPTSLTPGGPTKTFTVTASNPSSAAITDAHFDLILTGDDNGVGGKVGLKASQVHISYSDPTTSGKFVDLPLSGETTDDGEIHAFVNPDAQAELPPGAKRTATFKISLDPGAPDTSASGRPLRIETDLDQFDPADGSESNLDYVGPADVPVLPPSDTVSFQGGVFLTPPTKHGHRFALLFTTSCTITSQEDGAPLPCLVTGTASLTSSGGTLHGLISSADGLTTFTESFVYTSPTTQSGSGPATEHDTSKHPSPAVVNVSTTTSPTTSPLALGVEGTIVVTDKTSSGQR